MSDWGIGDPDDLFWKTEERVRDYQGPHASEIAKKLGNPGYDVREHLSPNSATRKSVIFRGSGLMRHQAGYSQVNATPEPDGVMGSAASLFKEANSAHTSQELRIYRELTGLESLFADEAQVKYGFGKSLHIYQ